MLPWRSGSESSTAGESRWLRGEMRLWILGDSAMRGDSSIAPLPNATLTSEYNL